MYYKVLKGTKLYDQLTELMKECRRCNNASLKLAKEVGAVSVRGARMRLAGGISSFLIETGKPDGWKASGTNIPNEYYPSKLKANKELRERIDNLPVVTYKQLNDMVGYDDIFGHPGFVTKKNVILLDFTEKMMQNLKPVKDMVEITRTEFFTTKNK